MNLLTIKGLSKTFTEKKLFDGVDFSLEEGEKVGVIGINGTGKSTLLRIIAGLEEGDGGEYVTKRGIRIGYLPQNPVFEPGVTLCEYVTGEQQDEDYDLSGEAKSILNRLGFTNYGLVLDRLSGGQRKKAALAAALLRRTEILILDEPTNHLDSRTIEWLEEWLRSYRGALIMVTHDRYFLDLVCTRIVEINKGHLYSYKTNYEGFVQLKAEREEMALSTQKKHENILRKEIAWIRRGARARSTKQKAHIARYEALRDEEKIVFDGVVELEAVSSRLGKKTVELENVKKTFGGRTLIDDLTFIFLKNDRVGIIGPNGCGKTTLLRMITGALAPDSGRVTLGETVSIAYYAQECETMDPEEKAIDYIRDTAEYVRRGDQMISASQMLEKFLFDGVLQHTRIGSLSGGERRRLYLAKILMGAPNVLILDEPTNDLDISTLQVLEDYLDSFAGIVIAVSHDRYFLDRVARRLLTFEEGGRVELFNGSYTEYFELQRRLEKEQAALAGASSSAGAPPRRNERSASASAGRLRFSFKEQKEYETIEADIEALEEKQADIDAALADPALASDYVKLAELTEEREKVSAELDEKMERYVYLEELAEKIRAQEKK